MMSTALERTIRLSHDRRVIGRCDLCGAEVSDEHRHLLDTDLGQALCSCAACTVLFNRGGASNGHYRLIPRRRMRLPELSTQSLGVPVGLAYFVRQPDGAVIAHYPSAIGATEWDVDAGVWARLVSVQPMLGTLTPDVEALLVDTARGASEHWLLGIDDCFRLVAVVRAEWTGMSGGSTVWPAIATFFAELSERKD